MLVLTGTFDIDPGSVDDAIPYFQFMVKRTLTEPGCQECGYSVDVSTPGRIRGVLHFDDHAALLAHRNADYVTNDWNRFADEFNVRNYRFQQFVVTEAKPADWNDRTGN